MRSDLILTEPRATPIVPSGADTLAGREVMRTPGLFPDHRGVLLHPVHDRDELLAFRRMQARQRRIAERTARLRETLDPLAVLLILLALGLLVCAVAPAVVPVIDGWLA